MLSLKIGTAKLPVTPQNDGTLRMFRLGRVFKSRANTTTDPQYSKSDPTTQNPKTTRRPCSQVCLCGRGLADEAERYYKMALLSSDDVVEAYYNLGLLYITPAFNK